MANDRDPRRRTPAGGVPVAEVDASETQRLRRAVRDTQETIKGAATQVDLLRGEFVSRLDQMEVRFGELAIAHARMEGKLDVLVETSREDRGERRTLRLTTAQTELEIERTGATARINEAVAVRADRRQLAVKAVAVIGPAIAAAVTWLVGRC